MNVDLLSLQLGKDDLLYLSVIGLCRYCFGKESWVRFPVSEDLFTPDSNELHCISTALTLA